MIETIKVKLQPFSAEAFKPYGQMLESKQPIFPEVEPGEGRRTLSFDVECQNQDGTVVLAGVARLLLDP